MSVCVCIYIYIHYICVCVYIYTLHIYICQLSSLLWALLIVEWVPVEYLALGKTL